MSFELVDCHTNVGTEWWLVWFPDPESGVVFPTVEDVATAIAEARVLGRRPAALDLSSLGGVSIFGLRVETGQDWVPIGPADLPAALGVVDDDGRSLT